MSSIVFILISLFTQNIFADQVCPEGKHWVDAHFRNAYIRYDGVRVQATRVQAFCRKNPRGYDKWHKSFSNKRPKVWGYKKEKSKKWSVEENQRLYNAISVLPSVLQNLKGIKVYRMSRSQRIGNPATSNQLDIVLYDIAFMHEDSLAQIISHELAHRLYGKLSADDKKSFISSAGWLKIADTIYIPEKSKKYIKQDSKTSIEEDFANHIEYFLFKPNILKNKSLSSYKWIQKQFGSKFQVKEW